MPHAGNPETWLIDIASVPLPVDDAGELHPRAHLMSKVLRVGREQVSIDDESAERPATACPACGTPMTHHADKVVAAAVTDLDVTVAAVMACASCGASAATMTTAPASQMPV